MPDGDNLPLVLAGPILRRVEPSGVSIWIALSASRTVRLGIWPGQTMAGTQNDTFFGLTNAQHTHSTSTIRVGDRLHLALIHLDLSASPLGSGNTYSYNLVFEGGSSQEDLNKLGLLKDVDEGKKHLALGYQNRQLPSFVLPSLTLNGLNIVHASCRKAHGPGKDALVSLDKMLKRDIGDADKRPHALFLTGDQVYADDVAMCLLPSLTEMGNLLLGKEEKLKVEDSLEVTVTKDSLPSGRRKKLCFEKVMFSSTEARSHVLSFGEFCALYLFSWSDTLWPDEFPTDQQVLNGGNPPESIASFLSSFSEDEDEIKKWKESYNGEKEKVEAFKKTLINVRRVLANVPVYMIFDDHEVTDDWYLTQEWKTRVLGSPMGRNVIRNGLLAFALFQAWGNDPVKYKSGPYANLLTQAQALFPTSSASGPTAAAGTTLDGILGLDGSEATVKWHSVVPCGPAQAVMLDTRTRRGYQGNYSPPGLMDDSALLEVLNDTLRPSAGAELLFIVSPAPVLGLAVFEELIQPVVSRVLDAIHVFKNTWNPEKPETSGSEGTDMEAWGLAPAPFEKFLERIYPYKKIVFLSGDVHYAFSAEMDYWKQGESQPTRLVQLTASASKNEIEGWKYLVFTGGTMQKLISGAYLPAERMGWDSSSTLIGELQLPAGRSISPQLRTRLKLNPTLLSPHYLPEGTTITIDPEWSWRLNLLKDQRPDDDAAPNARPSDARDKAISTDLDHNDPADGYVSALVGHEHSLTQNFGRRVVQNANFGLLKLSGTGDSLKISHQLMFMHPEEDKSKDPQAYTVHDISLAASTDPRPGNTIIST